MARRVIHWISNAVRYPDAEPHFHQGPDATPSVCYEADCGSPRLDV